MSNDKLSDKSLYKGESFKGELTNEDFAKLYRQAKSVGDAQILIDSLPYGRFLGIKAVQAQGDWQFQLPPKQYNVGNPTLPALHGGAIAGFMETSAVVYLLMTMDVEAIEGHQARLPKIVDFSIDYVRACRLEPTYAACEVLRQGRKLCNVAIRIWQRDATVLTASARAHYLLD